MSEFNFSPFPELQTERLILRKPDASDIIELKRLRSNELVNKYIDRPKTIDITDVQKFLSKINDGLEKNELLYWAIAPKSEYELKGTIGLWNFSENKESCEIGYELHPSMHGRGIMQEAIKAVIDFGFRELKLKQIIAFTHPDNSASQKILERNGFVIRGRNTNENRDYIYSKESHIEDLQS